MNTNIDTLCICPLLLRKEVNLKNLKRFSHRMAEISRIIVVEEWKSSRIDLWKDHYGCMVWWVSMMEEVWGKVGEGDTGWGEATWEAC